MEMSSIPRADGARVQPHPQLCHLHLGSRSTFTFKTWIIDPKKELKCHLWHLNVKITIYLKLL